MHAFIYMYMNDELQTSLYDSQHLAMDEPSPKLLLVTGLVCNGFPFILACNMVHNTTCGSPG